MAIAPGGRPIGIVPLAPPVPERVTVLAAADRDQTSSSSSDRQHGLFSYVLMKGLRGEADLDGDRRLTIGELARYARERVRAEAQAMNRKQEPLLQGEGADRVIRVLP